MHKFVLICLLGVLASAVVVVASECPNGDLSGNCAVGFEDVLILAQNWLGGGRNPGDIIPDSEINMLSSRSRRLGGQLGQGRRAGYNQRNQFRP